METYAGVPLKKSTAIKANNSGLKRYDYVPEDSTSTAETAIAVPELTQSSESRQLVAPATVIPGALSDAANTRPARYNLSQSLSGITSKHGKSNSKNTRLDEPIPVQATMARAAAKLLKSEMSKKTTNLSKDAVRSHLVAPSSTKRKSSGKASR